MADMFEQLNKSFNDHARHADDESSISQEEAEAEAGPVSSPRRTP